MESMSVQSHLGIHGDLWLHMGCVFSLLFSELSRTCGPMLLETDVRLKRKYGLHEQKNLSFIFTVDISMSTYLKILGKL